MRENKEIILVGRETREAVEQAIAVGGIEECQRLGLNIDEIRPAHPNEIVKETIVFENKSGYENAKEWLDAVTIVCLPIWLKQMIDLKLEHLKSLKIDESGRWLGVAEERNVQRKSNKY